MARPSKLSLMSVESLIELRDDVSAMLSNKADELKRQLARLTGGNEIGNGEKQCGQVGERALSQGSKGRPEIPRSENRRNLEWPRRTGTMADGL